MAFPSRPNEKPPVAEASLIVNRGKSGKFELYRAGDPECPAWDTLGTLVFRELPVVALPCYRGRSSAQRTTAGLLKEHTYCEAIVCGRTSGARLD